MTFHESPNHVPVYATAVPIPIPSSPSFSSNDIERTQCSAKINTNTIEKLKQQGFTSGLAHSLSLNNESFPLRIWVVDNSGSMNKTDGKRIVPSKKEHYVNIVECTRWVELKSCVNYHAHMAGILQAPTTFRFLNRPGVDVREQEFSIAKNSSNQADIMREVQNSANIMNKARPNGTTPLTAHILEIQQSIMEMAPDLIKEGKRVAIILATDGLPTDTGGKYNEFIRDQFVESLRLLEGLPVWVVIRLCTDDDDVVNFYNDLDEQLELSLEVLDDFIGEAKEVHAMNPWLNYALPLHRCREMGYYDRLFDLLDERSLTKGELRDFCALLFGEINMDGVVDPIEDWDGFYNAIVALVNMESQEWDPIKKSISPWINLCTLRRIYGPGGTFECKCVIM